MGRNNERILLLQLKRIGDFILTAPAVAALRASKPDAEIVAVVPAAATGIARCFTCVSRVLPYRTGTPNLRAWASVLAGSWDACIDFAGTDRTALMTRLSRAKKRVGCSKFADSTSKSLAYTHCSDASVRDLHTVDFHLALAAELAAPAKAGARRGFALPPAMSDWASAKLSSLGVRGPYAVVHPGTARAEKQWLPDRWAAIISRLVREKRTPVVLTGSNSGTEHEHLHELRAALSVPVTDLTGRLSLLETAAVIASAGLVFSVDSMATHLAAAFERPQIVLFGPTNPYHWRPRHPGALVIKAGREEPVTEFSPQDESVAMNLISTEQIINAMRALRA